ncbi:hypothetical protein [Streptomyces sp. ISL-100]|uniref:hypothetical protein n=1 Tax=Streptomyces sp. ISL-100 TaxID=2819173 RepID=UPI001BE6F683|nr:hypothetical protein [Streptomyces sp. ISL-100]MBT2401509.1 hypothetical protein [Streptomyces sp. ISL-100]
MTKKPKLTVEEHASIGARLAGIRDELTTLYVELANAYPQSGPEAAPARKAEKALKSIDDARSDLENALYWEHPEQAATTTYYPHREDRAQVG